MLIVRPAKARRNPAFSTRMNPASTTRSTRAVLSASMYARSASSSSFVRNLPGGMKRAGICRSPARARMPASATSLNTSATSAGTVLARQASATATKFEPLPEPSTPMRKLRSFVTRFSYRHRGGLNKPQVDFSRRNLFTAGRRTWDAPHSI